MTIDPPHEFSKIVYSVEIEHALRRWKRKDRSIFEQIQKQIEKVVVDPTLGKPLRYTLKNRRRLHVGSFVLVYEYHDNELRFLDFDHHDKVYKKYR